MEHSKLPWIIPKYSNHIHDGDGKLKILGLYHHDLEFIVEACNNYEKLQQINKELVSELEYIAKAADMRKLGYTFKYIDMIQDLIKRAKEV